MTTSPEEAQSLLLELPSPTGQGWAGPLSSVATLQTDSERSPWRLPLLGTDGCGVGAVLEAPEEQGL